MTILIPVLALRGRLDAHTVPALRAQLLETIETSPKMIVDLTDVHFIDSSALGLLVQFMKRCRAQQGDLYLCSLSKPVQIIFELTRMNQSFMIFADRHSAHVAFTPE